MIIYKCIYLKSPTYLNDLLTYRVDSSKSRSSNIKILRSTSSYRIDMEHIFSVFGSCTMEWSTSRSKIVKYIERLESKVKDLLFIIFNICIFLFYIILFCSRLLFLYSYFVTYILCYLLFSHVLLCLLNHKRELSLLCLCLDKSSIHISIDIIYIYIYIYLYIIKCYNIIYNRIIEKRIDNIIVKYNYEYKNN